MTVDETIDALRTAPSFIDPETGFTVDITGMDLAEDALRDMLTPADRAPSQLGQAHREMQRLEAGEIKNPDEGRKVTHFTDRIHYPESDVCAAVEAFADEVRQDSTINAVVINGIGGSALGPQLLQFACRGPYWNELTAVERQGYPCIYFVDNTDTAGLRDVLDVVNLAECLVVTISKSGGTQETKNTMIAFEQAYAEAGLDFASRAIAITMEGSLLYKHAMESNWRNVFPMAESIGGRTSETNVVGHVPAALTGIDFQRFLEGARRMDKFTREPELTRNPAYQLAAAWYITGNRRGDRNMVIVPYADRLVLLGKYLQQLVMESLGKELDRDGDVVHQGLTVYGNKGGTDAHAYIQQLNDGRDDFFVTFIEPLRDAMQVTVEEGVTMGDYLHAFKEGLVAALRGKRRKVIDIVMDSLNEQALGMLVALYERAVAVYAEFININAFHQPGVQAYKLASKEINALSERLRTWLTSDEQDGWCGDAAAAAEAIGTSDQAKAVAGLLAKYTVNGRMFAGRILSRTFQHGKWLYSLTDTNGSNQ
ncbi:MAG: glucose-6-phosphate isomerase [Candidatus Pacebacteria bacterium]|nr:glucose-6-phosphate isomerase [Candidatus Paceibacterota bacterium]